MLVLDSGGLSRLCERSTAALALIRALRREGLWPPLVPSAVLVESLTGDGRRDARTNLFLGGCDVIEELPDALARRAAFLRTKARRGSAVDALVVATAEPGGTVLTSDPDDLEAIAARAAGVYIEVA
jgi:hypothetical protein